MKNTNSEFDAVVKICKDIFVKKMKDYGPAWRILRPTSLTDQIFIKTQRIKSIEEAGIQKVADAISDEYKGIINYCVIALIQLELGAQANNHDIENNKIEHLYDKYIDEAKNLMLNKNHDYGEAWRDMRMSSLTDLILMKVHRVKQIEDNKGKTIISEGIAANYLDMLNYAVFSLIKQV